MKRIHLALVLVAAFLVAAIAPTADAKPVGTLELNLGYAKSSQETTPDDESLGGGIAFGASYWRKAAPTVMWGFEGSFDNLGNDDYDNGDTATNEVSSRVIRVNPALRVMFGPPASASFFAQAGAGLYNVSANVEDSILGNLDDSETKFGFNVGAGVSFNAGPRTRMNIQGQYHSIATEFTAINYVAFRAGIGFPL